MIEKISAKEFNKMQKKTRKGQTAETIEKATIKAYLKARGFFYYHNLAGMGVYPGISDFTVIKWGVVLQLEVKKPKGGVQSQNQKDFQASWEAQGGIYICGCANDTIEFLENFRNGFFK